MNASRNHLKFGTFTREDAKRWPYLFLKSFQNVSTNRTKIHEFGVKGTKINQKGAQENSESDLGSKSVLGPPKSANARCAAHAFEYHMGDLGRHFGYRRAPSGPKIKCFGARMRQNLKT